MCASEPCRGRSDGDLQGEGRTGSKQAAGEVRAGPLLFPTPPALAWCCAHGVWGPSVQASASDPLSQPVCGLLTDPLACVLTWETGLFRLLPQQRCGHAPPSLFS